MWKDNTEMAVWFYPTWAYRLVVLKVSLSRKVELRRQYDVILN